MPRYFLEIAYNGTRFHGWQIQDNAYSVQAEVERVLFSLFSNTKTETTGCGRTDAGVHARQFFLHFDAPAVIRNREEFVLKMNKMISDDIVIYELSEVSDEAHARFDAASRSYEYVISRKKNPFTKELNWYHPFPLNVNLMNEAAQVLLQYDDFASFCKSGAGSKTTVCKVTKACWEEHGDQLIFRITADRFLRNMVRAIVGTLMQVGKEQLSLADFERVLQRKERAAAGESVPASGLFLTEVTYSYICPEKR